ncbi:MAG: serine/threonine-protein kinase [Sandaracinus sp.]
MSEGAIHVGRYELIERLGHGHTSEVHLARTVRSDGEVALVALRRPLPAYAADPRFVEEFLASARRAAQLLHPGIARVLDVSSDAHAPFVATEYVHGEQLSSIVRRLAPGQRPLDLLLRVIALASEAVEHAHAGRTPLVHASLTPQNVFVAYDGEVRVADFGTPRAARRDDDDEQRDHGGLAYWSPEQAADRLPSPATDVFALGILLWECITQRGLFVAPTRAETRAAVIRCEVPRPGDMTDCPAALERLVLRCLAADPRERPPSAGVLADELEDILRKRRRDTSTAALARLVHELFAQREAGREATMRRALRPSRESYAPLAASSPSLHPPAPRIDAPAPSATPASSASVSTSTASPAPTSASEAPSSHSAPDAASAPAAEVASTSASTSTSASASASIASPSASASTSTAASHPSTAASTASTASRSVSSTATSASEPKPTASATSSSTPASTPTSPATPSSGGASRPWLAFAAIGGLGLIGMAWLATRGGAPEPSSRPGTPPPTTLSSERPAHERPARERPPTSSPTPSPELDPHGSSLHERPPDAPIVQTEIPSATVTAAPPDVAVEPPTPSVDSPPDELDAVEAPLRADDATLEIVCRPAAEIFLDNRSLGLTPRIVAIPSGAIAIGLRSTGPEHQWRTLRTTLEPHATWTVPMSECP